MKVGTMKLSAALNLRFREIISFVGGGGKTSLMLRLAEEIPIGCPALITATTKINIPPADKYPVFIAAEKGFDQGSLQQLARKGTKAVLGQNILPGNKLNGVTLEQFEDISGWEGINYILAEADGANGRPLKGHLSFEPVIPHTTTLLVIVAGADALGKNLDSEHVHRPEVVAELTGSKAGTVITPETISKLIVHPRGIMRSCPPQARKVVVFNKVDCLASLDKAYQTAQLLVGDMIDKVILCSAISKDPVVDIIYK